MQTYLIYLATNQINQKKYVGQTKSGRLDRRVFEHLQDAKIPEKNVAFHNALNKYGIDNFKIEIIEENIPEEQIDEREQYWIGYYNTYIHAENSQGYNETLGGQGTRGYVFTDADRLKMSNKQKTYWAELPEKNPEEYARLCEIRRQNKLKYEWTDESRRKLSNSCKGRIPWNKGKTGLQVSPNKGKSKYPAVCQYDLETGKFVQKFSNTMQAAEAIYSKGLATRVATAEGRIFLVCQANKGHAYGYIWRFDTGIEQLDAAIIKQEHRSPQAKAVLQYDLAGNLIAEFESAAAYSRTQSTSYDAQRRIAKNIANVCNGKAKTYYGFVWKYKEC